MSTESDNRPQFVDLLTNILGREGGLTKETYKRDIQKRHTKETYKRDIQKRHTKETLQALFCGFAH